MKWLKSKNRWNEKKNVFIIEGKLGLVCPFLRITAEGVTKHCQELRIVKSLANTISECQIMILFGLCDKYMRKSQNTTINVHKSFTTLLAVFFCAEVASLYHRNKVQVVWWLLIYHYFALLTVLEYSFLLLLCIKKSLSSDECNKTIYTTKLGHGVTQWQRCCHIHRFCILFDNLVVFLMLLMSNLKF